jgi:hypothetical protein
MKLSVQPLNGIVAWRRLAANDIRAVTPATTADLQASKPINPAKRPIIHVLATIDRIAFVIYEEPAAAVLCMHLHDLRQSLRHDQIVLGFRCWSLAR